MSHFICKFSKAKANFDFLYRIRKENIYDMGSATFENFYGIPEFIEKTKKAKEEGSVGIIPGIYTTDENFDQMSEEREKLSRFIKELVNENRYNPSVRNLTIYTTLLLQYIGGMLRRYLKGKTLTGLMKSKLTESMNNCNTTYEILRTIDEGDDGRGKMCVVR